ncbi:MAG: T9SS type A sorting domain-containing protein [Bacteroidetes bacterium]|nr:T9SS type A sorting domain-containing protein [Bacteroidota bacterium]
MKANLSAGKAIKTVILLIFMCYTTVFFGQYVSVQNGDWSNGSTWNTGTAPPSWGGYTVVVNHDVTISGTITGANWQLTVNAGGYLHEVGCQTLTTWDGNALWTNYGIIDVYQMDGPGKVVNYGTITVDRISSAFANSRWTNNTGATITCIEATFNGNADFINQGTFTASCVGSACWGPTGWGLEFNGDSLVNSGTITTCTLVITSGTNLVNNASSTINIAGNIAANGCIWTNNGTITMGADFDPASLTIYNGAGATLTAAGDFFFSNGTSMTNYGTANMSEFQLNASTLYNYGPVNASQDFINNSGSAVYNYGCNCFATPGTITVQGNMENYDYIENNGLFTVNGTAVANFGSMGTTVCGKFDMPGTTISADNSGLFFGVSIICAQALNCWGCQMDPTVFWTCNTPSVNCDFTVILPIELIAFNAYPDFEKKVVEISWETASEKENYAFEVERSVDNVNWRSIYTLAGSGPSQTHRDYFTTDTKPVPGFSYYRLKQIDMDGEYSYSETVSVAYFTDEVYLFPNPASTEVFISGIREELSELTIFSVHGAVLNPPYQYDSASRMITIDIAGFESGVYVVKVKDAYFPFIVSQP